MNRILSEVLHFKSNVHVLFSSLFAYIVLVGTFTSFVWVITFSILLLPMKSKLKNYLGKFDDMKTLEENYLKDIQIECLLERNFVKIESSGIESNMTSLVKKGTNHSTPLLFVHGTSASSLGFATCMVELSKLFSDLEIHALDLPGFGVSSILDHENIERAKNFTRDEIVDFYCEILQKYIKYNFPNNKVILMGHSFGGFLCIQFVSRFPQLIDKIIILGSGGIFPIQGEYGNYWAVVLKTCIPQSLLQVSKKTGLYYLLHILINNANLSVKDNIFFHYYVSLLSNDESFANIYVGKFIHLGILKCQWVHPSLPQLLDIIAHGVPVFMIYGNDDTIMPFHQGEKICQVLNQSNVSLHVIPNASHVPYIENQQEFCKVVKHIINRKNEECTSHIGMYDGIKFKLRETMLKECIGTFSLSDTLKSIEKQYKIFHDMVREKDT